MIERKPKRRWFKFSIRELLLITAIAALSVGWWLDHRALLDYPRPVLHYLSATDARLAMNPLQAELVGTDARIMLDERNNAILATARRSQQAVIQEWVKKFDRNPSATEP